MRMAYLDIRQLCFSYNAKRMVLKNIDLKVAKGEWIAILGHNGSGKSTLAKTIVGLLRPQSGSVTIDDIELNDATAYEVRKKVGIVFQNPDNQFVGVTVRDDIAFGMENLQVPRAEMEEKIRFYAVKVEMLPYLDKVRPCCPRPEAADRDRRILAMKTSFGSRRGDLDA